LDAQTSGVAGVTGGLSGSARPGLHEAGATKVGFQIESRLGVGPVGALDKYL
jgi:hypothetical protein